MEMPEGWKRARAKLPIDWSQKGYSKENEESLIPLLLLREMAEALESSSVIYYPNGFDASPDPWKVIKDHNDRSFKAIEVLKRFQEWK